MYFKCYSLILAFLVVAACGGDGGNDATDPGPYQLSFSLDASFQNPHGGHDVYIALVRLTDGIVVATDNGTVSATENPTFTFTTASIMERGISYAVHYWIDSNIGGGTPGVCDATMFDHQWSTEFYTVSNDIDFIVGYEPGLMEYVCSTFP